MKRIWTLEVEDNVRVNDTFLGSDLELRGYRRNERVRMFMAYYLRSRQIAWTKVLRNQFM